VTCCTLQIFFKGRECKENVSPEQEYREFDPRHVLENGLNSKTDAEKVIIRIISLILDFTFYTDYFNYFCLGSPGSWNCRSRVAGQAR
jgi:hypothetical protein